jgi:hypothetical protein
VTTNDELILVRSGTAAGQSQTRNDLIRATARCRDDRAPKAAAGGAKPLNQSPRARLLDDQPVDRRDLHADMLVQDAVNHLRIQFADGGGRQRGEGQVTQIRIVGDNGVSPCLGFDAAREPEYRRVDSPWVDQGRIGATDRGRNQQEAEPVAWRSFQCPLDVGTHETRKGGPIVSNLRPSLEFDLRQLIEPVIAPSGHQRGSGWRDGQRVDGELRRRRAGIGREQSTVLGLFQPHLSPPGFAKMLESGGQYAAADRLGDVRKGAEISGFVKIGVHGIIRPGGGVLMRSLSCANASPSSRMTSSRMTSSRMRSPRTASSRSSAGMTALTILGRMATANSTANRLGPA